MTKSMRSLLPSKKSLQVMVERSICWALAGVLSASAAHSTWANFMEEPLMQARYGGATIAALRRGGSWLCHKGLSVVPIRPDRPGNAGKRIWDELGHQQPCRIDRTRHRRLS